jgi:hypothetical protein
VRTLGFLVVLIGFLWILGDCVTWYTAFQHGYVWRKAGELPVGAMIERDRATRAMWDISSRLNERHRDILLPAFVMLAGSFVVFLCPARRGREGPSGEREVVKVTGDEER